MNIFEVLFWVSVLVCVVSALIFRFLIGRQDLMSIRLALTDALVAIGVTTFFRGKYPTIALILGSMVLFGLTAWLAWKHIRRDVGSTDQVKMIRLRRQDGLPIQIPLSGGGTTHLG